MIELLESKMEVLNGYMDGMFVRYDRSWSLDPIGWKEAVLLISVTGVEIFVYNIRYNTDVAAQSLCHQRLPK